MDYTHTTTKVSQTMEITLTFTPEEYTALATAAHEAGFSDVQSFALFALNTTTTPQ